MTERNTMSASAESSYLRDVSKRLEALTLEQREAVLDDIRAHFADVAETGRSPEQAVESLGGPARFTEQILAELGHDPGRAERMGRRLQWLATGVAVFTAMFASFLWPDDSLAMPNTQFQLHGFGIVLWYLIPSLVAVLPNLVPRRARIVAAAAAAIVLTAVPFTFPDGELFAPTVIVAWSALAAPRIARHGRPAPGWRIAAGALTAFPGALALVGALTGSYEMNVWIVLQLIVIAGLGVLIAVGKAWAGTILAVAGTAVMVLATLDPGYLVLAFWWAGGLYLALGASHALSHARPRTPVHA